MSDLCTLMPSERGQQAVSRFERYRDKLFLEISFRVDSSVPDRTISKVFTRKSRRHPKLLRRTNVKP